jgi:hypothetical protein
MEGNMKRKHRKPVLIKFDDLIPRENVRGGRKTVFGAYILQKGRKEK